MNITIKNLPEIQTFPIAVEEGETQIFLSSEGLNRPYLIDVDDQNNTFDVEVLFYSGEVEIIGQEGVPFSGLTKIVVISPASGDILVHIKQQSDIEST